MRLQGGLTDGRQSGTEPRGGVSATASDASGPSERPTATDGGQPPAAEPRNVVAGAIAGTDWTHDDVTVALSAISTFAIVLWLLLEVSDR